MVTQILWHYFTQSKWSVYLEDISIGLALVGVLELRVADEDGVHVGAGVLVELVVAGDHDHSNLHVAEDAQFVGLLQETTFPLAERNLNTGETRDDM